MPSYKASDPALAATLTPTVDFTGLRSAKPRRPARLDSFVNKGILKFCFPANFTLPILKPIKNKSDAITDMSPNALFGSSGALRKKKSCKL